MTDTTRAMTWEEHEAMHVVKVQPPSYAQSFATYPEASNSQDNQELADEFGGFHAISLWDGRYWLWRV